MPKARHRMDKRRARGITVTGTLRRLLETPRLNSWATKKTAKEKEKRTQPYANSPSFKKDFTLNEDKKQKPTAKRSRISSSVGRKPVAAPLPEGSASVPLVGKATRKENRSHAFKKAFDLFIVFQEFFCFFCNLRVPASRF
jgi:hypothetical protein